MIYPREFEHKVGFDRIRSRINELCLSEAGREKASEIRPCTDPADINKKLGQTAEFQKILELDQDFPLDHFYDMRQVLGKMKVEGTCPEISEVFDLKRSLLTLKRIYNFFSSEDNSRSYPELCKLSRGIKAYPFVIEAVDRIMTKEGAIKDNASPGLSDIRSELRKAGAAVSRRMQSILKQAQNDGIVEKGITVAVRNGRGVIPVNVYDKNKIQGLVHDQSASGKTVYIEPAEIVNLNNQIIELEYAEKREIIKILIDFTDRIRPYIEDLLLSYNILGEIDLVRAKALLGQKLKSLKPVLLNEPVIRWTEAVHPLLFMAFEDLPGRRVVPLDIELNKEARILLISGPNAGGKSVCLTTVGLLQYMLQCGLTVPVRQGSEFGIFSKLFINIGDEQSIENDLSTYSSHLENMKYFLRNADENTLLLIDEFGTGTEPVLGGAIAEAILGELNRKQTCGVITTHYTNLKHYASAEQGIVNGAMMFDNHRMEPLFRLDIGKPGSSFAFEIARRIGLPEKILETASEKAGQENINFDKHLKDVLRDKRYWDRKRQTIRIESKKLEDLVAAYQKEISELKSERKEIIRRAREEAENILAEANKTIEKTIREIREAQAEKERTRKARKELEEMKKGIQFSADDQDKKIAAKINKLKEKQKKVKIPFATDKEEPEQKQAEQKQAARDKKGPLVKGEKVVMEGSDRVGEVISADKKSVSIAFGNIITTVNYSRVRRATGVESNRAGIKASKASDLDWDLTGRRVRFSPDRDVRGMRAEEALNTVREFIDEAIMVQYRNLRILHGKGDGILRQVIREYLSTADLVKDYHDEKIEAGGSGITIVELDL
ncbi:MAG: Smr/MutS family protein [Bacteroidales bacterium]|nr:Smr/MutS family protein [Bacteroidales bacterium]